MKKLEGRAILCLILAAFLVLGSCVFVVRLALEGGQWASFCLLYTSHMLKKKKAG